jgi:hypothetical protein
VHLVRTISGAPFIMITFWSEGGEELGSIGMDTEQSEGEFMVATVFRRVVELEAQRLQKQWHPPAPVAHPLPPGTA